MKKIITLLVAASLCVVCAFSASAAGITADEQKIIDALSKDIKMNSGAVVSLPDKYINQAEDYLTKADLTNDQITEILGHINNASAVVAASSANNLSSATTEVKEKVIDNAKEAANVINANLSVKKNGEAGSSTGGNYTVNLVFDSNSTVDGYTAGTSISLSTTENEVVQTGAEGNMTVAIAASVVLLAAVAFVFVVTGKKAYDK